MTKLIFLPFALEVTVIILISMLLIFLGFWLIRKKLSHEDLSEYHTVASYIFNAFSITYGVLLAFVVYANWYDNERAQQNVSYEASYISNFYRDTRFLPDSAKKDVTDKLAAYTKSVIEDEWVCLSDGRTSSVTDSALDDLWKTYTSIPVTQISNPYIYQLSVERLNFISQYRRLRILDMQQTTPTIIWTVLIICFAISIAYTVFFTTREKKAHLFLIATFIIINILIFYLIYVLDHPYKGTTGISSEPFQLILNKFKTL